MPYIGRGIETLSDRVVLDSLTASATASYTLQLNSVNFVPSSAESLTVSLNGVIQAPISSYTVSGSTLTFSSALTSSDSIDFVIAERGITLQTPSAGSVNTDQLASSAVTNAKIASDAAIATTKLGTGAVLQVVQNVSTTFDTSNSTSFVASSLSASITPSSTSNKVLIFANATIGGSGTNSQPIITIYRNATTNLGSSTRGFAQAFSSAGGIQESSSIMFLDSPSSTSSTSYKVYFKVNVGDAYYNADAGRATMTLMEIAG